jgi:acyl carrier protein
VYAKHEEENDRIINRFKATTFERASTDSEKEILYAYDRLLFSIGTSDIGVNTSIFEIGVSSIDVLTLRMYIQEQLDVEIPVAIFFSYPVIRDLAKAIDVLQEKQYDPVRD